MQTNLHASSRWDAANSSEGLALRPAKDKRHRPPEQLPRCELLAPAQVTPQKAALRAAGGSKHRPSRNGLSTNSDQFQWLCPGAPPQIEVKGHLNANIMACYCMGVDMGVK